MSPRYYLPIRHDVIAKYFYEAIRRKKDPKCKIEYKGNEFIDQDSGTEYWWNVAIKTAVNCHIIEFSCPADVNVMKKSSGET